MLGLYGLWLNVTVDKIISALSLTGIKGNRMVYGYFIKDTVGSERFFIEGCSYCLISTGGQHEANCPCKDIQVADREKKLNIPRPYWNKEVEE